MLLIGITITKLWLSIECGVTIVSDLVIVILLDKAIVIV
jgi:hypothetical protein